MKVWVFHAHAFTQTTNDMKKLPKQVRISETRAYQLSTNPSVLIEVQLFDIDFYPEVSAETLAFIAKLSIKDGNYTFMYDCYNDGQGGSTTISPNYVNSFPSDIKQCQEMLRRWNAYLSTQRDDNFYAVAEQMGWKVDNNRRVVRKSAESEVSNLLAEWCDKHHL